VEISQKKMIAGIGIYEVLLVTFVFIFEPYGRRMSSSEWTNFWTWFFVVPIAAILIFYLFIWGSGKNIKLIKIKNKNKKFKFDLKRTMVDFYNGKLSLALSFWAFGFLGSVIMGAIGVIIFQSIVIGRLIAIPWQLYALIGIWSSADNYKGLKVFPILAKIFIVIWIINNVGKLIYSIS
jgi:hypothetical protein|tara:strand:+ start:116 stop:652 length:537 start_codon:yes stop_codon:yes gene_type:complete